MKKKTLAITFLVVMILSVVACSSSNTSSTATSEVISEETVTSEVAVETEEVTTEDVETSAQETENAIFVGTWVYEFEASEETAYYYDTAGVTVGDTLESKMVMTEDGTGIIYLIDTSIGETLAENPIEDWMYSESDDNEVMIDYLTSDGQMATFLVYYSSDDNTLYNENSEYHKVEE